MNSLRPILFLTLIFLSGKFSAQVWSPLGGGLSGPANVVTVHDGKLFVGGYFQTAGNSTNYVSNVAQWNDTTWSDLHGGADYPVNAFCEYNGDFYAGGRFTGIGGNFVMPGISIWNGTTWDSVGGGITPGGWIDAMIVYNGKLIVAGSFSQAGSIAANDIAAWDGNNWSTLGNGFHHGHVSCLEIFNGELYAGGSFDSCGTSVIQRIAKWDGTSWSQVGEGFLYGMPLSLKTFQGKLYAGGSMFVTTGFHPMHNFAVWDGTAWNAVEVSGADNLVNTLFVYGNYLLVGGSFSQLCGAPVNCIAAWDGTTVFPLGTGISFSINTTPFVSSIYVDEGVLYAGGYFDRAGGDTANNIARWDFGNWMSEQNISVQENISVYPNPSNGIFTFHTNDFSHESTIDIYNSHGEKINSFPMKNEVQTIDLSREAQGIYFYQILDNGKIVSQGKIICANQ